MLLQVIGTYLSRKESVGTKRNFTLEVITQCSGMEDIESFIILFGPNYGFAIISTISEGIIDS
jgi:hypothetical protein